MNVYAVAPYAGFVNVPFNERIHPEALEKFALARTIDQCGKSANGFARSYTSQPIPTGLFVASMMRA